jgi:hypothetical protein
MYFVDPHAEMCLYKLEQERLTQRLEVLRGLESNNLPTNAIVRLTRSLASTVRRARQGSSIVSTAPTPLSQHQDAASACRDELAA